MVNRVERLQSLFLSEIASFISGKGSAGIRGVVTITGVEISKSLEHATVYFSVYGTPEEIERTTQVMESKKWDIRHLLRDRVRIRRIPDLSFKFDNTPGKAARLENIFRKIEGEVKNEGQ